MGGDFAHRWTQTRESIEVMKKLWTQDVAEHSGSYYNFPNVRCYPKPAQKPHPPVFIGGWAKNVHTRIAEWADGWIPHRATPKDIIAGRQALDDLARGQGRKPSAISITVFNQAPEKEVLRSFEATGADRITFGIPIVQDEKEALAEMRKVAKKVLN